MKIRIFALARDLGLDSKVLIDLCEEAGVKLRNALATISEEERDIVVAYLRRKGTPGAAELPTTDMAPVREQQSSTGRVRVIGAMGRGTGRPGDGQSGDAGVITDDDLAESLSAETMDDGGELAVESAEPVSEVIEAVVPVVEPDVAAEPEQVEAASPAPASAGVSTDSGVSAVYESSAVTEPQPVAEAPVAPVAPVAPAPTSVAPVAPAAAAGSTAAVSGNPGLGNDASRRPRMQQLKIGRAHV